MRKRMVRIYNLRGKNRKNLILKILLYIFLFRVLKLLKRKPADSIGIQFLFDLRISFIPLFVKRSHRLINPVQLLLRCHA